MGSGNDWYCGGKFKFSEVDFGFGGVLGVKIFDNFGNYFEVIDLLLVRFLGVIWEDF